MEDSLQSVISPPAEPDDEPCEARSRYRLTASNQWYLVFVVACYALMEAWRSEHSSALGAGFVVGQIISSALLSALLAWIGFRLGGRSKLVGSVAFNGALTLFFFGQVFLFKTQMENRSVPAEKPSRRDASPHDVRERVADMVFNHGREMNLVTEEWKSSWGRMVADVNFDYLTKPDDAELKRRRGHFAAHAQVVKKILEFHDDAMPKLHRRCADLPHKEELAKALEGVAAQHKLHMAKYKPLWDEHLTVAEMLVSMTDLLIDNPQGWSVADDTLVFDDPALAKHYGDFARRFAPALQRADERAAQLRSSP